MHLVPGCPAHVLLPLLMLFYNMFEQINNQSINQSMLFHWRYAASGVGTGRTKGYMYLPLTDERVQAMYLPF